MGSSSSSFYAHGTCSCGAISLGIDMKPFLLYNCHCSHCRRFASSCQHDGKTNSNAPYHGGGAVFKWNVAIRGKEHIEYEQSSSLGGLFAMSRGRCRKCKEGIWESGERAVLPFAMVMGKPLLANLEPNVDMYYDSGFRRGPTTKKVLYSDLGSLLYELAIIVFVAIPCISWSLYKRMMRPRHATVAAKSK